MSILDKKDKKTSIHTQTGDVFEGGQESKNIIYELKESPNSSKTEKISLENFVDKVNKKLIPELILIKNEIYSSWSLDDLERKQEDLEKNYRLCQTSHSGINKQLDRFLGLSGDDKKDLKKLNHILTQQLNYLANSDSESIKKSLLIQNAAFNFARGAKERFDFKVETANLISNNQEKLEKKKKLMEDARTKFPGDLKAQFKFVYQNYSTIFGKNPKIVIEGDIDMTQTADKSHLDYIPGSQLGEVAIQKLGRGSAMPLFVSLGWGSLLSCPEIGIRAKELHRKAASVINLMPGTLKLHKSVNSLKDKGIKISITNRTANFIEYSKGFSERIQKEADNSKIDEVFGIWENSFIAEDKDLGLMKRECEEDVIIFMLDDGDRSLVKNLKGESDLNEASKISSRQDLGRIHDFVFMIGRDDEVDNLNLINKQYDLKKTLLEEKLDIQVFNNKEGLEPLANIIEEVILETNLNQD